MRYYHPLSVLIILLVLPSMTMAGTLENVTGTADCDGWSADLTVSFRSNAMLARVEYVVLLLDYSGAEVERFEYSDFIDIPEGPTAVFTFGTNWSTTLSANHAVSGSFTVYDVFGGDYNTSHGSFRSATDCGTTSRGPVCLYRAGYWATHPEEWPTTSLEIAGQEFSQSELMAMLEQRGNELHGGRLTGQLIAAKLNLANGGSDAIQGAVDRGDDLLANRPPSRRGQGYWSSEAMRLASELFRYNRGGCDEGADGTESLETGEASMGVAAKADDSEAMSLGTLKAMYR